MLARRGGPGYGLRSRRPGSFGSRSAAGSGGLAASRALLQDSVRREAAGPPRHAVSCPPRADTGDQLPARDLAGSSPTGARSGTAAPFRL